MPIGAGQLSVMAKPVSGDWIEDEFAGLRQLGIDHVVSLLEESEQYEVGLVTEPTLCAQHCMRYTSFPIVDRDVPESTSAQRLVRLLHGSIYEGEHVVIHCRAGIGRTGMIASAILIEDGYSAEEAIHIVSFARGVLVPDTDEQDQWVRSFSTCNE